MRLRSLSLSSALGAGASVLICTMGSWVAPRRAAVGMSATSYAARWALAESWHAAAPSPVPNWAPRLPYRILTTGHLDMLKALL